MSYELDSIKMKVSRLEYEKSDKYVVERLEQKINELNRSIISLQNENSNIQDKISRLQDRLDLN